MIVIAHLLAAAFAAAISTSPATPSLAVDGTEFVLTAPDGHTRRSNELVGAEIDLPSGVTLRIDAVEREIAPGGASVWLHTLSMRGVDGEWHSPCEPDPDGRRLGFPLPGRFDDAGFVPDRAALSLSCTSGARAKCVRFGYAPWGRDARGDALLERYNACVRMVRADYCGDGQAHTVNGTLIDIYDRGGVQVSDASLELAFEAGWSAKGAVCVGHPRIAEKGTLEDLLRECPRLRDARNGAECTEEAAARAGAVVFNRSR